MKSGIFDKNGVEIKEGDTLVFPYITPMGDITDDPSFTKEVVFKYGCFGYETLTGFVPLMDWMKKETGEYVPNEGNKIVFTEEYIFWKEL